MKPISPGQSAFLLSEVVPLLEELGIQYAVIGALAASFHGVVRSSLDADALLSGTGQPESVKRLISRLRECGFEVEHRKGAMDDPVHSVIIVSDHFQNRVDLLTGIRGLPPDFLSRRIEASLLGTTLHMIGAEDLIAMKLFAGSPRDLEDARGVIKVSGDSLDYPLLERLAANYGAGVLEKLTDLREELRD